MHRSLKMDAAKGCFWSLASKSIFSKMAQKWHFFLLSANFSHRSIKLAARFKYAPLLNTTNLRA